ncbi:hypothetical protein EMPG_16978, partial [Blastomyces silverae]
FAVYFILARASSKAENSFDTRASAAGGLSAGLTTNMRRSTSFISAIVSNTRNSSSKHQSIVWPL